MGAGDPVSHPDAETARLDDHRGGRSVSAAAIPPDKDAPGPIDGKSAELRASEIAEEVSSLSAAVSLQAHKHLAIFDDPFQFLDTVERLGEKGA